MASSGGGDPFRPTTDPEPDSKGGNAAETSPKATAFGEAGDHRRHGTRSEAATETGTSSPNIAATNPETVTLDQLRFHALRAIRYHDARGRFLDRWRRIVDLVAVVGGAGATIALFSGAPLTTALINLAVAFGGGVQLVLDLSKRSQEHTWVRKKFSDLLGSVIKALDRGDISEGTRIALVKQWCEAWADEPPTMHILEAMAHNATCLNLQPSLKDDDLLAMTGWQTFTANYLDWENYRPLTKSERRELYPEELEVGRTAFTRWLLRYS